MKFQKNGLSATVKMNKGTCSIALSGRLTVGTEDDEACPVTAFQQLLQELLDGGMTSFTIDLTHLKEIDTFGISILKRLQHRAPCALVLPGSATGVEPLIAAVELLTKFDWTLAA
jgi:hypothetical protein